jgi:hypothetical protein
MRAEHVIPEEILSRFILNKNHFSVQNQRVKYAAFLPAPNGETSVFRTSQMTDSEIWAVGDKEVSQKRNKPLLGRADVSAVHAYDNKLKVIPDDTPPRHANITGWPDEKSEQKLIALELAKKAQLHLR